MNRRRIWIDTLIGVAFGLFFPLFGSLFAMWIAQGPYNLAGFAQAQAANPLLWIIDSAPLVLGIFAYFVGMRTARLEATQSNLAMAVAERGRLVASLQTMRDELEKKVSRQVTELKATAHVGRAAAGIYDQKQLLEDVTELISTQFGFYHTGIFLIDEAGEYAVLQAANSEGGRRMLGRGHKLPVGRVGLVGYVASRGQSRIVLDVGQDATFFNNPDLPETRSEMALPLRAGGQVIGVLDVQSNEPAAFAEEDAEVLQLMADQVALAIQNSRLIENSQRTIQELENLYKGQLRRDWNERLGGKPLAYHYDRMGVEPTESAKPVAGPAPNLLDVPLVLRGEKLGMIQLRRDENQPAWTDDERLLAQEAAGQVAAALENARLFSAAQEQAQREQLLSGLSRRMTQAANVDALLKMAAQEVGRLPGVEDVSIQIGLEGAGGESAGGQG